MGDHFAHINLCPIWGKTQPRNEMTHMNSAYTTTNFELDNIFGSVLPEMKMIENPTAGQFEDYHHELGNPESGKILLISGDW